MDLRRGDKHIYGFLDFWMFVIFFPQLIAGPLVRHNEIIPQFARNPRGPDMWENLGRGLVLFIIGVSKKVVIADTLAHLADPAFSMAAPAGADRRRGLDRRPRLHLPALFRLLRLLRHGDRPGADVRAAPAVQLQLALQGDLRRATSGGAGTSPCRASCATTSTSRSAAAGSARCGRSSTSSSPCCSAACGTAPTGTASPGAGCRASASPSTTSGRRPDPRCRASLCWAITFFFFVFTLMVFHSPGFGVAGRFLLSMVGAGGLGHVTLDREHWLALGGGAALAFFGMPSQDIALRWLQPRLWLAVPVGAVRHLGRAAGRGPAAECLLLLPVLSPPGGASSSRWLARVRGRQRGAVPAAGCARPLGRAALARAAAARARRPQPALGLSGAGARPALRRRDHRQLRLPPDQPGRARPGHGRAFRQPRHGPRLRLGAVAAARRVPRRPPAPARRADRHGPGLLVRAATTCRAFRLRADPGMALRRRPARSARATCSTCTRSRPPGARCSATLGLSPRPYGATATR